MNAGTTWREREDWCDSHGMRHFGGVGHIDDNAVYGCTECGALVLNRHQHADWHIAQKRAS